MKRAHRTLDVSKLSAGVRALNPHLIGCKTVDAITVHPQIIKPRHRNGEKPDELKMNKTEANFHAWAKRSHPNCTIIPWPVRLRWGGAMHYKPDFGIRKSPAHKMRLIEVKGAHIFSRDIVRFKGCREEWKDIFDFELWHQKDGLWVRML